MEAEVLRKVRATKPQIVKNIVFSWKNAFWSLSPGPHQLQSAVEHRGVPMVIKSQVPAVERRMPNIVRHSAVVTCE